MTDRTQLLEGLETSAATFTASLLGLSPAQFHFKPGLDRWSVAETAEHVIVAETGSGKLIRGKLVREQATPELIEAARDGFAKVDRRLLKRDTPFPAPDFVMPTGRWPTPEAMIAVFEESRRATIDFLKATQLDLTRFVAPHPALGPLNGEGWLLFLIRHAVRHIEQIDETKAAPGYPR